MEDKYIAADALIADLKQKTGIDYTAGREQIADTIDQELWNGNWDSVVEFLPEHGDPNLRDLRIIEENEYDQSMDEDEKPDWASMLADTSVGYVFFA